MLKVRDVMTVNPVVVPERATLPQIARIMDDHDIGDVIVGDNNSIVGILTDRDMVVRGLAGGRAPETMTAGDVCTRQLTAVQADDPVATAVSMMRDHAVRRLPVTENGDLVGIVSIGDLAEERDPNSVLSAISGAPPNN